MGSSTDDDKTKVSPTRYIRPYATYSVPSQAPLPRSRPAVATFCSQLTGLEKIIVIGSEWYFKEDGEAEVKKRFEHKLKQEGLGKAATIRWDDEDSVWVLMCLTNIAKISAILVEIIQDLVAQELPMALDYDSEEENVCGEAGELWDEDGEYLSNLIIRLSIWKRMHGRPEDKVYPITDEETADTGTAQISVKKYSTIHSFSIGHVLYTESTENVGFQIKYLASVNSSYHKNTLLDNLTRSPACDYYNLHEALTIRHGVRNVAKEAFQLSKTKLSPATLDKDEPWRFWDGFIFLQIGSFRHVADVKSRQESELKATKPPPHPILNAEQTSIVLGWASGLPQTQMQTQITRRLPEIIAAQPPQIKKPDWDDYEDYQGRDPIILAKVKAQASGVSRSVPSSIAARTEESGCSKTSETITNLIDDDVDMMPSLPIPLQPIQNTPIYRQPLFSKFTASMASELQRQRYDDPHPRYHQTINQKAPKPKPTGFKGIGKIKSNPFPGRLEPPSPPWPLQTAPAPVTLNVGPPPELTIQINSEFEYLVLPLRGHVGEVRVQLEFGRLIVKNVDRRYIAREETTFYNREKLMDILAARAVNPEYLPRVYFTNILTTVPRDIQSLVKFKDQTGQGLWNTGVKLWRLVYEFVCHRKNAPTFQSISVEINGRNAAQRRFRQKRDYGAVNVYGTKRQWDFRISAVGYEADDKVDPLCRLLSDEVAATLHVPSLPNPSLTFKIDNEVIGRDKLSLDAVRVHRQVDYPSVNGQSVLHINEVYDLDMESRNTGTYTDYRAMQNTNPPPGIEKVDHWYNVSISSIKANEKLAANRMLKLGDEAAWTVDDLSSLKAAEAMVFPGCEMLMQMDGIGLWNNNGVAEYVNPITHDFVEA
ncbi:hypothetical protein BJ878DRAFT_528764 [Calycina marina]|uniref:Uncharacterized protein n=1 Tax=Calycina marina TaxID=1763456 RepID=A0A9P8CAK4_9HELO|nr:hypothetical protein BJ878DRAFT_528764 [Calycina marina]